MQMTLPYNGLIKQVSLYQIEELQINDLWIAYTL